EEVGDGDAVLLACLLKKTGIDLARQEEVRDLRPALSRAFGHETGDGAELRSGSRGRGSCSSKNIFAGDGSVRAGAFDGGDVDAFLFGETARLGRDLGFRAAFLKA